MSRSILFLGSQMATGGAQQVLRAQAAWFHRQGWRVIVAFLYDKEGLAGAWQAESPFPVVNLDAWHKDGSPLRNSLRLAGGLVRLLALLRRSKVQVIETFTPHSNLIGLPLAWLAGTPVRVGTHHGRVGNPTWWLDWLHGRLINSPLAACLVAVSPQACQTAVEQEGVRPERIRIIPNGIDFDQRPLLAPEERARIRESLDVPEGGCLALSVGRLVPQKGHATLLEALPQVLERFPQTVLAVAGDGPLRPELTRQAQALGIAPAVRWLGNREDVPTLLAAADLFVLPSLSEGLPVALLEAMAAGLPVAASRLPGIESAVETGHTGLLVPPGDPPALAAALISLLGDPERRKELGSAAQTLVRERFTLDKMCMAYERLFTDLRP